MKPLLNIYKPQGITPFQLIEKLRENFIEYRDIKIGFAGRLDPLAHGVMLLLLGDENKKRDNYLNLDKSYKFSVLFGVETDTYDYLGVIKNESLLPSPSGIEQKIQRFIRNNTGEITQTYPPFSSKTIDGIPLYKLAKSGLLDKKTLPQKKVMIYSFEFLGINDFKSEEIKRTIIKNLSVIKGYFRQKKIIAQWRRFLSNENKSQFQIADFLISCSSGTYVRDLANRMGQEFGCGAIAYEILRPQVGIYKLEASMKIRTTY